MHRKYVKINFLIIEGVLPIDLCNFFDCYTNTNIGTFLQQPIDTLIMKKNCVNHKILYNTY